MMDKGRMEQEVGRPAQRDQNQHEQPILNFLYDEGPSTSEQIGEHLGISTSRTSDILGLMKDAGLIVYRRLGQPPSVYWMLAGDA